MSVLLTLFGSAAGLVLAYVVLGRRLSGVFGVDANAVVPSVAKEDGRDFVPTRRWVVFAHHFTSIAGTGPIVGPAVAVFWGWLPALVWVLLGSVLVGAVHDFGSLVVSLKNGGATVGEAAGRLISPRARWLFLTVLWLALTVVLGVFGLVIASVFNLYPESVLPVWAAMPLAILLGRFLKSGANLALPVAGGLAVLLGCVWLGAEHREWFDLPAILRDNGWTSLSPIVIWTVLLLIYCYFASVMPVGLLLQPRDLLNSGLLFLTMAALVVGAGVAGASGAADLDSAPMIAPAASRPFDAPAILPFLFVTVACGACSGFHCLVASGTSSKQLKSETDARPVGYGAMLAEAFLAVLVILACTAGLGMNAALPQADGSPSGLTSQGAWEVVYAPGSSWASFKLPQMIGAFVVGGANFLQQVGVPIWFGVGLIATTVAGFAATTLDSATRLQRYVVQELAGGLAEKSSVFAPLTGRHPATLIAVLAGGAIALLPTVDAEGVTWYGKGGLILWPLFGATNQLLAGLAFLVIAFYLRRRRQPVLWLLPAAALMVAVPAWAMTEQVFAPETGWLAEGNWLLATMGVAVLLLEGWVVVEAVRMWPRAGAGASAPRAHDVTRTGG